MAKNLDANSAAATNADANVPRSAFADFIQQRTADANAAANAPDNDALSEAFRRINFYEFETMVYEVMGRVNDGQPMGPYIKKGMAESVFEAQPRHLPHILPCRQKCLHREYSCETKCD